MIKITKPEDAYFFAGSIIACKPTSYYGNIERNKLFNDLIFAKVDSIADEWTGNEIGLGMEVFSEASSSVGNTALTKRALKEHGNGYLDVRHATSDEIKLLKDLIINDKAQLAYNSKEETIEMLTEYLVYGLPPYPYVDLPIKEGKCTDWERIDPFEKFEVPKEFKIIGESNHAMSEL